MDGVLIPYSIGPFLISSAAFAIVMSLERIAVSTSPSVLHSHHTSLIVPESDRPPVIESPPKRSLRRGIGTLAAAAAAAAALRFGPSKTSTLSSAYGTHRSRADLVTKPRRGRRVLAFQTQTTPPLSTLWRLLQFPLHLSILVAGCGLRMIVQSLFNEWSGISNYISTYPPGLENLDPTISAASRSPFMDPSLLSSDSNALPVAPQISSIPLPSSNNRAITTTLPQNYASLLMNYTIQQGTSTRSAWAWDPTRGETLLSLGLAAFVVFAAASSMTLSVSNSILACTEEPQEDIQPIQEIPDSQWTLQTPKRLPRRRPHTNPSSLPPLFPSPPPLLPHPSIASLPATKDPSSTPLTTPMTRSWTRLSRRPSKLSTSALPPSRDLSEREEAFWRDVWVTSPEASVKSRRGGTVKSKRGTGKKMKEAMSSESEDESSDSLKDGGFYEDGEGREDDEDVEVVASTSSPLPTPQPVSRCVSPTTRQTPLRGFLLRVVLWGGLLVAAVPLGWWMGSWSGKVGTLGNDVEGWPLWNGTGIIEDEGTVMRGDADGFWTLVICCGVMVVGMVGEEVGRFRRGMALEHDVV
ncbi:hypothetical protein BC829DRAFT_394603 [Chytridium lagenaria]|nr:hypothetical protein BC829DRAFT_394603 [Chytridium lagenaria]